MKTRESQFHESSRMRQTPRMLSAVLFLLLSCFTSSCDQGLSHAEYEIYEMILNDYLAPLEDLATRRKSENPDFEFQFRVLVISPTVDSPDFDSIFDIRPERLPLSIPEEVRKQMVCAFDEKTRSRIVIGHRFPSLQRVQVMSEAELYSIAGEQLEALEWHFGRGARIRFSRVGFDDAGEYGVLYYSRIAGPLSGAGIIVVVQRIDDGWKILEMIDLWIS